MTKNDWLNTANMVITVATMLVAPIWSWWVIKLITHPRPNPAPNTDTNRAALIRGAIDPRSLFPAVVIVLSIFQLHREVHSTAILDRRVVVHIALDVALLCFGLGGAILSSVVSTAPIQKNKGK